MEYCVKCGRAAGKNCIEYKGMRMYVCERHEEWGKDFMYSRRLENVINRWYPGVDENNIDTLVKEG